MRPLIIWFESIKVLRIEFRAEDIVLSTKRGYQFCRRYRMDFLCLIKQKNKSTKPFGFVDLFFSLLAEGLINITIRLWRS